MLKPLTRSLLAAACGMLWAVSAEAQPVQSPDPRPNIIFIGAEDISPTLGCYGDPVAKTPNLDRLAAQGARFERAFTHSPVCGPSRSGMITGMYPTSIGTHHMRSKLLNPPRMFTHDLRQAGYHVQWPGKTDFNFDPPADAFDSTERWTTLEGIKALPQPFFAYVNFNATHESRHLGVDFEKVVAGVKERTDPASVRVPAYFPDTPEVRQSIARHYDTIQALDAQVGRVLDLIDQAGLSDNTVVVFWGDHGAGFPRGKRWLYDSGTRCPLIVRWPGRIVPGSVRDDLVAVVDFAPTFLSIAGVPLPDRFHGIPFLQADGRIPAQRNSYVFSARDRMDEVYDRIRSVRDSRWRYIRNEHPELPYAQVIAFPEPHPILQQMRQMHAEGLLVGPPALFFAPVKTAEELYDTLNDPDEVNNLAKSSDPVHQSKLAELRNALDQWRERYGDLGLVPEEELIEAGMVADHPSRRPASNHSKS